MASECLKFVMLVQNAKTWKEVKSYCKAQGLHLLKLQPQQCVGEAKSINLGKQKSVSYEQRSRLGVLKYKLQGSTHSNGKEVAPKKSDGSMAFRKATWRNITCSLF